MTSKSSIIVLLVAAGCTSQPNSPLIFGQTQTVGITIAGSPAQQGGEFTVGYRDADLAIVPVTVTHGTGEVTQLNANVFGGARGGDQQPDTDAFAVLGQFEVDTNGTEAEVGLGKFFATGLAARRLADGFACALSEGAESGCPGGGAPAPDRTE
ncbi:MAG TPA: hypothetical protein VFZ01_06745 [Geminicoccaceae bacterium]